MSARPFPLMLLLLFASACTAPRSAEGVRASDVPPELRDDYALFATRCSKCHGLSRALSSAPQDEVFWARYVTRMRLQPSSGIAPEEEKPIVRYLNHYSAELRAAKERSK